MWFLLFTWPMMRTRLDNCASEVAYLLSNPFTSQYVNTTFFIWLEQQKFVVLDMIRVYTHAWCKKKCTLLISKTCSRTVLLYFLQYVFELPNNQLVCIFRRSLRKNPIERKNVLFFLPSCWPNEELVSYLQNWKIKANKEKWGKASHILTVSLKMSVSLPICVFKHFKATRRARACQ